MTTRPLSTERAGQGDARPSVEAIARARKDMAQYKAMLAAAEKLVSA